ncbi:MAG TPA: hypothetical protein PKZ76_02515 [Xanthomonadaceae bacterium]|nr:hypothetical protein [Xanthomonadaceae bacterium]
MNNVLWNCQQGLGIYAAPASAGTAFAYEDATSNGKTHCVFVVSPQRLPVFGLPWGKTESGQADPNDDVTLPTVFNFNVFREEWDVTEFGQVEESGSNRGVDRLGRGRYVRESAYDWGMPAGKPILSVARGRVLAARDRDVTAFNCPSPQKEIYVHHRVGSGEYAEEFVTYYAHLSSLTTSSAPLRYAIPAPSASTCGVMARRRRSSRSRPQPKLPQSMAGACGTDPPARGRSAGLPFLGKPFGWAWRRARSMACLSFGVLAIPPSMYDLHHATQVVRCTCRSIQQCNAWCGRGHRTWASSTRR